MGKLHVYATEYEWFVAESIEEAVQIGTKYAKDNCMDLEGYMSPDDYNQCDDKTLLTVHMEDEKDTLVYTRTCGMWAATMGKGFLCSENY